MATTGHRERSWYSPVMKWINNSLGIESLAPFPPHTSSNLWRDQDIMTRLQANLFSKYLDRSMESTFPKDGLIQKSFPELFIGWIHTHQDTWMFTCPTVLTVQLPIGQLKVSSHQLQFEIGWSLCIPRPERFCKLCERWIKERGTFCPLVAMLHLHTLHHHLTMMEKVWLGQFGEMMLEFQKLGNQPLH